MNLDLDLKTVLTVLVSLGGAALIVHRFVSSMRAALDVFGVRLDAAVAKVDAVATKLEAADVSLLRHRIGELDTKLATLDDSHHRLGNIVTAFQLRVATGQAQSGGGK